MRIPSATADFRPSYEASAQNRLKCFVVASLQVRPFTNWYLANVASADFWQSILASCNANSQRQIDRSPGVRHVTFAPYTLPIYFHIFRMIIGLRPLSLSRPDMDASYALPVRRAGVLLTASFRFRFTADTLAVQLMIPPAGVMGDFPPDQHQSGRSLPSERALPGAHKKRNPGTCRDSFHCYNYLAYPIHF